MDDSSDTRPVLVAVANPARVEQLVRTASDLARVYDEPVRILSVVSKPSSSPFSVFSDDAIVERFARDTQDVLDRAMAVAPDDVAIEREIRVARSVADGVLDAIGPADARALVIGWRERRSRSDAVFGSNLDRLVQQAPCDLYVERIGYEANGVDSILLPVAGGPHVRPAAAAAKAIAARNDATIHVLSIVTPDGDADAARADVEAAVRRIERAPGSDVDVETLVRDGDDVADELVEAVPDHEVVIFGVTRQSAVHRRLVGSIPQTVIPRTDRTVILARSGEVVEASLFGQLGRFWRHTRTPRG